MRKTISILFALALVLSFSLVAATPVSAAIINVPGDYGTIQAAINAASAGDTISVAAGTYAENINIPKSVTLLGPNAGKAGYAGDRVAEASIAGSEIRVTAPDVTIDGFKLSGTNGQYALSPLSGADTFSVLNNVIEVGMCVWVSIEGLTYSRNLVQNTDLAEVYGSVYHNAIYAEGGGENWTITHNKITEVRNAVVLSNVRTYSDIAISKNEAISPLFMVVNIGGNTIIGNMTISDNIVTLAGHSGVYFSTIAVIDENAAIVITDNVISAQYHGVFLAAATVGSGSEIIVECNTMNGPGVGVRVYTTQVAGIVGRIRFNSLSGNSWGVYNDTAVVVDAADNWWGAEDGPGGSGPGSGDKVSTNVLYDPWIKKTVTTTATGTGPILFSPSAGNILSLTPMAAPSLPSVSFPHGMFSFQICCLTPGQTVTLTVTLPSAVPVGTVWWKYDNGRWHSLPNLQDNGNNIMMIQFTDGGTGDSDGLKDGFITDPGGPGNPMTVGWDGSPTSKAAVMIPIIGLLAAIAGVGMLVWRRRRAEG